MFVFCTMQYITAHVLRAKREKKERNWTKWVINLIVQMAATVTIFDLGWPVFTPYKAVSLRIPLYDRYELRKTHPPDRQIDLEMGVDLGVKKVKKPQKWPLFWSPKASTHSPPVEGKAILTPERVKSCPPHSDVESKTWSILITFDENSSDFSQNWPPKGVKKWSPGQIDPIMTQNTWNRHFIAPKLDSAPGSP